MAGIYRRYLRAASLGEANTDLLTEDVKIVFVDGADYTENLNTDEFLTSIPLAARIATSGNLVAKTMPGIVFDANDITIASVSGDQFEKVVGFIDTGVEATSRLVWLMDSGTGLPFTPAGSDITSTWAGSGIFSF